MDIPCGDTYEDRVRIRAMVERITELESILQKIVSKAVLLPIGLPPDKMEMGYWRVESSLDGWIADARRALEKEDEPL